jgi:hypothetical protein
MVSARMKPFSKSVWITPAESTEEVGQSTAVSCGMRAKSYPRGARMGINSCQQVRTRRNRVRVLEASWQASAKLCRIGWLARAAVVEDKLHELGRVLFKAGFDPSQPRVPAGNPDGGRWTGTGGTSETTGGPVTLERIVALARRITTAGSPLDYQRCLNLCYPLLERPQHPASDRNMWDFHKCMNACLNLNL